MSWGCSVCRGELIAVRQEKRTRGALLADRTGQRGSKENEPETVPDPLTLRRRESHQALLFPFLSSLSVPLFLFYLFLPVFLSSILNVSVNKHFYTEIKERQENHKAALAMSLTQEGVSPRGEGSPV